MCGFLDGSARSYALNTFMRNIGEYSNLKKCPVKGYVYMKVDKIPFNNFIFEPLLPSGRYRVDFNLTEGNRDKVLIMFKMYIAVSDYRIEVI